MDWAAGNHILVDGLPAAAAGVSLGQELAVDRNGSTVDYLDSQVPESESEGHGFTQFLPGRNPIACLADRSVKVPFAQVDHSSSLTRPQ